MEVMMIFTIGTIENFKNELKSMFFGINVIKNS